MYSFPGYSIEDTIDYGSDYVLFRGFRIKDHTPVLIRVGTPRSLEIERAILQYLSEKNVKGIPIFDSLVVFCEGKALVLQDIVHGKVLKSLLPLSLEDFFYVALKLAIILSEIHESFVIHQDIRPANIHFNQLSGKETQTRPISFINISLLDRIRSPNNDIFFVGEVQLLGFSRSVRVSRTDPQILPTELGIFVLIRNSINDFKVLNIQLNITLQKETYNTFHRNKRDE
jgi:serine/threonine protein kinase